MIHRTASNIILTNSGKSSRTKAQPAPVTANYSAHLAYRPDTQCLAARGGWEEWGEGGEGGE